MVCVIQGVRRDVGQHNRELGAPITLWRMIQQKAPQATGNTDMMRWLQGTGSHGVRDYRCLFQCSLLYNWATGQRPTTGNKGTAKADRTVVASCSG